MLYATKIEKQLYTESCQRHLTLAFGNGTVLQNDSIFAESMELEQTLCDEDVLTFGRCPAACIKVRIFQTAEAYKGQKLIPTVTTGEFSRQLGVFWVESDQLTSDKLHKDIVAYDALYTILNTDVAKWYNALAFPMTQKEFRDSFFSCFKIEQEDIVLPNDTMTIEKTVDANELSGGDVIQSICELNACFGNMNEQGKFRYVFLKTYEDVLYPADTMYPSDHLYPSDEFDCRLTKSGYKQGSLTYEDYKCRQITRVQVRQEENDIGVTVGEEGNDYIIEDNFLVYGKGTGELNRIAAAFLQKAQFIPFYPAALECRAHPWLQVGDYVKAIGSRDVVIFPVLHRTMSGISALIDQYEAKGTEYFGEKVNGIQYDMKQLKGKSNVLERTIEETRSTVTDVEAGFKTEIKQTADAIKLSVDQKVERVSEELTKTTSELHSEISQTAKDITFVVGEKIQTVSGDLVTATEDLKTKIEQTSKAITSEVSAAYQTKGDYPTTTIMETKIKQTADSISQEVRKKVDENEVVSFINQSAEEIKIKAEKIALEGIVTANDNVIINTDGTITAKNANIEGTITSANAYITGGTIRVATTENTNNFIELTRGSAKVQIGNDGMYAEADDRTASFMYSQIGVYNPGGVAFLSEEGKGVSSYGWQTYSDNRLKNSIERLDMAKTADFVYSLEACRYKYNYDNKGIYRHGLIAQSVKEKMGDETWGLYDDNVQLGDETYLGLNYTELIADLIATVQHQNERMKALERKYLSEDTSLAE